MKITAFKIQEDGTLDLSNPMVVDTTQPIPDGYRIVAQEDDLTYGDPLEIEPQPPSEADRLEAIESTLLAILMMGG